MLKFRTTGPFLLIPLLVAVVLGSAAAQDATSGGTIQITTTPSAAPPPVVVSPTDNMTGTVVYNGDKAEQSQIKLSPWGGGSGAITSDKPYGVGGQSVKIVTIGLYEGAKIILNQGVDLGNISTEKDRYLQLVLAFDPNPAYPVAAPLDQSPDVEISPTSPNPGMGPQNFNPGGPGYPQPRNNAYTPSSQSLFHLAQYPSGNGRGRRRPGGYPGAYPGAPGGYPGGRPSQRGTAPAHRTQDDEPETPALPTGLVHLTLGFLDGTQTDIVRPVTAPDDDSSWIKIGIPLTQLPLTSIQSQNPQLKSLTIASDNPATIYVGRILIVTDDLPITCTVSGDGDIAAGDSVDLVGKAAGGASNLKFEWDFNTKQDFVAQAEGMRATHRFAHSGDYIVTLRVSDIDGIKQPAESTLKVHVED